MSTTIITIERVDAVESHPNADRLDMIQVLGYKVAVVKDSFQVGDSVAYFPPDILLPSHVVELLDVGRYLKHAVYPGDTTKTQCRVSACRLRGTPSHGFVIPVPSGVKEFGTDVTELFEGVKYQPPVRVGCGDAAPELANFPSYTNIQHLQRFPEAIPPDTDVVITEKIHGTNSRMGLVKDETGEFVFVAGSHSVRRKEGPGLYWQFFTENIKALLTGLCDNKYDVVLYGEIFGPGIQDMHYGRQQPEFRLFDIMVDGNFIDYNSMLIHCMAHDVPTVPGLYTGPFSQEIVDLYMDGPTTFDGVSGHFKGREGVVIRPLREQWSHVLGDRLIVKAVSSDYYDRRNATDIGE